MRASGILMHITSLPSDYGIGTMGKAAYDFADFLAKAGQTYWQMLPIGPTSYGDSPYQSFSTHAGNPYFIDLDMLREDGLLKKSEYSRLDWSGDGEDINYAYIYKKRFKILYKAYERFKAAKPEDFDEFLNENENWISNYALFMAIKDENGGKPWSEWAEGLRRRDPSALWEFKCAHADEVEFWEFLQYKFFEQWRRLKEYANARGIRIIGDMPIYVAQDSAPVWVYPDLFELDGELMPTVVAGCPPDGFSPTGQLWGNPIYNWARHKETGYNWWIDRMKAACELYDVVRIDHFRGFAGYYTIPYGDATAEGGRWNKGVGAELFAHMEKALGKLPVIAEDLGFLDDDVKTLLEKCGYPGMKVLEFAFDENAESDYMPFRCEKNSVTYIGTHDNPTALGWAAEGDAAQIKRCAEYIGAGGVKDDCVWRLIRAAFATASDTVIIQMQDYLEKGAEGRMNVPSVLGGNWQWRAKKSDFSDSLAEKIDKITKIYG
ncbi:MAG: 4-alpha-glucanotransferase, partial [Firmicutes bacterium]|nr:4-alpha-glucanotransferase [Bacillota bacterium]